MIHLLTSNIQYGYKQGIPTIGAIIKLGCALTYQKPLTPYVEPNYGQHFIKRPTNSNARTPIS